MTSISRDSSGGEREAFPARKLQRQVWFIVLRICAFILYIVKGHVFNLSTIIWKQNGYFHTHAMTKLCIYMLENYTLPPLCNYHECIVYEDKTVFYC